MNLDEIYDVILLTFNNQDTRYVIENKKINNNSISKKEYITKNRKDITKFLKENGNSELLTKLAKNFMKNYFDVKGRISFSKTECYLILELYQRLLEDILKENIDIDKIIASHNERILNFVQNVDKISDQNNISDYSPEFKLKMLELDKNKINGKVLELGCGKDGSLVEFLRKIGIDAYGIDQMCDDTSFLVCDDLTTYEYEENKYDLIIAYMTFSKDFLKAHTDQTTDFIDYAETFMKILNSLKVNGTFVYIPAIPFIEELLPEDKFLVHNSFLKDGEIMKTNIKRLK